MRCCWNPVCHCFRYHWYHCLTGFVSCLASRRRDFPIPLAGKKARADFLQESDGQNLAALLGLTKGGDAFEGSKFRSILGGIDGPRLFNMFYWLSDFLDPLLFGGCAFFLLSQFVFGHFDFFTQSGQV